MAEQAWAFSPANFQTKNSDADQEAGKNPAAPANDGLPANGYGAGARARMEREREQTIPPQSYTNEMVPHQERTAEIAAPVVTAATAPVGEAKTLRSILPKSAFGTKPASSAKKVPVDATAISETFANNWTAPQPTPASDTGPNAVIVPTPAQTLDQAATSGLPATPVVHTEKRSGAIGAFIQAKQAETGDNPALPPVEQQQVQPVQVAQPPQLVQPAQPVQKNPTISQFNAPVPYSQTEAQAPTQADIARAFAPYVAAQQAQEAPKHIVPVPAGLLSPQPAPTRPPEQRPEQRPEQQALQQQAPLPVAPAAYEQPLRPPAQEQRLNNNNNNNNLSNANKDVKSHPLLSNLISKPAEMPSEAYNARMDKQSSAEGLSRHVMPPDLRSNLNTRADAPEVVAAPAPQVVAPSAPAQEDPFACDNCYQSMEISPDGVFKTTITLPDLSSSKIETRNPDKSWAIALTDHLSRPTIEQRFDKNGQLVMLTSSRFDHVDAPMMPSHKIVKTATQTIETTLDQNGIVMNTKVMPSSDLSSVKPLA